MIKNFILQKTPSSNISFPKIKKSVKKN